MLCIKTMYAEIFYAVDGYMLKKYRLNCIIPDEIEKEIIILIDFWKPASATTSLILSNI